MFTKLFITELLLLPIKLLFRVKVDSNRELKNPSKFLIIWRVDNFGILLSASSLFRAIKDTYPNSEITLLTNNYNATHLRKPELKSILGLAENDAIINIGSIKDLINYFKRNYDVAIVPALRNGSFRSFILMRFSKVKYRIGVAKFLNNPNPFNFLYDKRIEINWGKYPDAHISQFILELVKPFGIDTKKYISRLNQYKNKKELEKNVIAKLNLQKDKKLIGINNSPELLHNRWSSEYLTEFIELLAKSGENIFYFIEESVTPEILLLLKKYNLKFYSVSKNNIDELLMLFELSNLFVTTDSDLMFIAGITSVPQISIFGYTNPFNWAPIGGSKYFLKKSVLINDVRPKDVFELAKTILIERETSE